MTRPSTGEVVYSTALAVAGVLIWCAIAYGDLDTWVREIDFGKRLFGDFRAHYLAQFARMWTDDPMPNAKYFYGPTYAILGMPLAKLPESTALWVWGGLQVGASVGLALATALSLRADRAPPALVWAAPWLVLFSIPVWHSFVWGQTGTLRVLLVLGASRAMADAPLWAALLFGGVIGLKPSGVLALPAVLRGRLVPFLVAFAAIGLVLFGVLPALVLGIEDTVRFVQESRDVTARATFLHGNGSSQAVVHVLARWLRMGRRLCDIGHPVSILVGIALAAQTVRTLQHPHPAVRWLAFWCGLGLVTFFVPSAWPHDFAFVGPGLGILAWTLHVAEVPRAVRFGGYALVAVALWFSMAPILLLYPKFQAWSASGPLMFVALSGFVALVALPGRVAAELPAGEAPDDLEHAL